MARRPTAKQIDNMINAIYCRRCRGVQIDIMDISKVFAAGLAAFAAGLDVEAAIVAVVNVLRKN